MKNALPQSWTALPDFDPLVGWGGQCFERERFRHDETHARAVTLPVRPGQHGRSHCDLLAFLVASEDEVGKHGEQGVFITGGRALLATSATTSCGYRRNCSRSRQLCQSGCCHARTCTDCLQQARIPSTRVPSEFGQTAHSRTPSNTSAGSRNVEPSRQGVTDPIDH